MNSEQPRGSYLRLRNSLRLILHSTSLRYASANKKDQFCYTRSISHDKLCRSCLLHCNRPRNRLSDINASADVTPKSADSEACDQMKSTDRESTAAVKRKRCCSQGLEGMPYTRHFRAAAPSVLVKFDQAKGLHSLLLPRRSCHLKKT